MSEILSIARNETDVLAHPAVRAWSLLNHGRTEPEKIETLKAKRKSRVYRLVGVGGDGSNVIAKCCSRGRLELEHAIHTRVLPRLPTTHLQSYGLVSPPEDECDWLFVEDAAGDEYSSRVPELRRLAARWLATLHTLGVAAADDANVPLPDRGPNHYRNHLESARAAIEQNRNSSLLGSDFAAVLTKITTHFDRLVSRWDRIDAICNDAPRVLVHGDLVRKNVRVRTDAGHSSLLVFDWETAGWGPPSADLARSGHSHKVDLIVYWNEVRGSWPQIDLKQIARLSVLGKVFRALAAIRWQVWCLEHPLARQYLGNMIDYEARLTTAMQALRWEV
jgi:thiamine kinase-like enzyme